MLNEIKAHLDTLLEDEIDNHLSTTPELRDVRDQGDQVQLDLSIHDPFSGELAFQLTLDKEEARSIDAASLAQQVDQAAWNGEFDRSQRQFDIDENDTITPVE